MSVDYEAGVIAPFSDDKKQKGSVIKGIGVGISVTITLELFIGLVLDVEGNLVHRYVSYLLGIAVLFVVAVYTKSIIKMFFVGTPVVILASFALPFLLPDTFSALMAPFVTLIPLLEDISSSLDAVAVVVTDQQDTVNSLNDALEYSQYGILVDLVIAMIVGTFASLGITGLVKVFTNKPGVLTIFAFTLSMIFFIIGVVLLPYILVITSGFVQFGLSFGTGALNMQAGMQLLEADDIEGANAFFDEASLWFAEGEETLQGLIDLQLFNLLGQADEDWKIIVDNGLILVQTAVDLIQAAAPTFKGVSALTEGIEISMG
ncbi:MAG: hypothetical protein ACXADH_03060, partial [Candidatus Kariarchaeaceae archaeon]